MYSLPPTRPLAKPARPPLRHPALPRLAPPPSPPTTTRCPQGRRGHGAEGGEGLLSDIVEVSGIVIAREETMVRPERQGLKVAEILADAGDTVTAGQTLARLTLPEGGTALVQAPVAGLIAASTAVIGAIASAKGEALFSIIARSEFDLVGLVPTEDMPKLAVNQTARIKIIGAGDVDGRVRRVGATVEPNSQLGQVFIGVTTNRRLLVNSSGRAMIKTGQSCNIAVPLDRGALRHRRHRGPGGAAAAGRDQAGRGRADVRRPGRNPRRPGRRRHRGRPRRRAAARGRPGAAGDGERG